MNAKRLQQRLSDWSRKLINALSHPTWLKNAWRSGLGWSALQWKELRREWREALNPPLRLRRIQDGAVVIAMAQRYGGTVHMLSTFGIRSVEIVGEANNPGQAQAGDESTIQIRSDSDPISLRFATPAEAQQAMRLITNAFVAKRTNWPFRLAMSVAAVLFLFVVLPGFFGARNQKVPVAEARAKTVTPAAAVTERTGGDVVDGILRDAFGAPVDDSAARLAPSSGADLGAGSGSLADKIYAEAKAAADKSMHENGPPLGAAPDAAAGDFGLGKSSGAGCDPALKFTVAQ